MLVLGFKRKRFTEFLELLDEESRELRWRDKLYLAWHIVRSGLRLGGVTRKEWRLKMRHCPRCPIFDKSLHRCRPFTGSGLGCGCFTAFIALSDKSCFADKHEDFKQYGWNAPLTTKN